MSLLLWLWPLSAGASDAASRIAIKKTDIHGFILNGISLLMSIPIYVIWLSIAGIPEVKPQFWSAVLWHVPMYVIILFFIVEAHRAGTMLKTMPLASLTPAFLLITGPLMGGGNPTFLGALGILVIVFGLYGLNVERGQKNYLMPFKLIFSEKASQFMFGATLIAALSSNLDKVAILSSSPVFYVLIDDVLVALILLSIVFIRLTIWGRLTYRNSQSEIVTINHRDVKNQIFSLSSLNAFILYGLFNVLTSVFHNVGLKALPHVPYFMAGKRAGAVIFAVIFGLLMWHLEIIFKVDSGKRKFSKEADNLGWKLAGTCLVVVGMMIVILYGRVENTL